MHAVSAWLCVVGFARARLPACVCLHGAYLSGWKQTGPRETLKCSKVTVSCMQARTGRHLHRLMNTSATYNLPLDIKLPAHSRLRQGGDGWEFKKLCCASKVCELAGLWKGNEFEKETERCMQGSRQLNIAGVGAQRLVVLAEYEATGLNCLW